MQALDSQLGWLRMQIGKQMHSCSLDRNELGTRFDFESFCCTCKRECVAILLLLHGENVVE